MKKEKFNETLLREIERQGENNPIPETKCVSFIDVESPFPIVIVLKAPKPNGSIIRLPPMFKNKEVVARYYRELNN